MTDISKLAGLKVGAAVCGSFCTFSRVFRVLSELVAAGCDVTPIMSQCAYTTDTRFGRAQEHAAKLFDITGKTVLHEITTTEPIGPKKMFDVLLVAPCTGNTLAKLAAGIVDTPIIYKINANFTSKLLKLAFIFMNTVPPIIYKMFANFTLLSFQNYKLTSFISTDYTILE